MKGIETLCKIYGSCVVEDVNGNSETWIYDYVQGKPRRATEMTKEEIQKSEKIKWESIKSKLKTEKKTSNF